MVVAMRECDIEDCSRRHYAKGLCKSHYERLRTRGTLQRDRIPARKGMQFISDVAVSFAGDECLLWPFGAGNGYGKVKTTDRRTISAHRIVCERIHGPPPTPQHEAAHNCGNSLCCNPRHLRWAMHAENQRDRLKHGTDIRGENHPLAKLSQEQVQAIRNARGVVSASVIARWAGISRRHVRAIQAREQGGWAWL